MRRVLRVAGRILLGFVALVLATIVLALVGIDYRPYLFAPYFRATSDRLVERTKTNSVVAGNLRAGFARVKLTPEVNAAADDPANGKFRQLPLAGFGNRKGKAATGTHDELWVKAVALEVGGRHAVFVASDALIIPREVSEMAVARIQHDTGLPREAVYFGATHSHSSLGGWGEGFVPEAFAGEFHPGVREWFASRLAAAVTEALSNAAPASLACGSFLAPDFVRNRLVGERGRIDPEFSIVLVRRDDGKTAVLGAYAAHATVLGADNLQFSADWPGEWEAAVESKTGGMAVFFAGGVGSHSPAPGAHAFEGTRRMGEALATRTAAMLPSLAPKSTIAFATLGLEVALPEIHARVTDERRLRPAIAAHLLPVKGSTFLQAVRLGDALWISTPCDFSGELALPLKEHFAPKGRRLTVTSFNGDYIGYIIPGKYYHLDGYEPRTMSFFGPTVPDYFEELVRRMGESVAGEP